MRIQLSQQAEEILGKSDLVIITERVDDVALLIGQMVKMGLPEVLDRHIPRHWKQRGISWGWTAVIWLAYILTEGDHRKVSVETYIKGMQHTLSQLTGQVIEPLDFSDDRLGHLLQHLSKPKYWHQIERDLNERSIEVYALPQDVILVIARDGGGITADHVLRQCVHLNAALIQVAFDLVPIFRLAQVLQQMAQPVVTEIQRLDDLSSEVAQGVLHALDVGFHRHLPVVAFREDIRQPDHRRPAPTDPPLLPMPGEMPVEHLHKAHLDHLSDE